MAAINRPFLIEQGATFEFSFKLVKSDKITPWDNLTSGVILFQMRLTASSPAILAAPNCTLNQLTGEVYCLLTAAETSQIAVKPSVTAAKVLTQAVYGIKLSRASGTTRRLFEGLVTISPEVIK